MPFQLKILPYLLLLIFSHEIPAFGGLGEKVDSIAKDQSTLPQAKYSVQVQNLYTTHEIVTEALTIKEYLSVPDGIVFGISWKGTHPPNFSSLMGNYYEEFQAAHLYAAPLHSKTKGRSSHGGFESAHLKLVRSGNFHWSQGKAYVPELCPPGVSFDEIQ